MKLKHFNYSLPEFLIAQNPLLKRDHARLMVIDRKAKTIEHDTFFNINRYLPAGCQIVLNNSKVIPARLLGTKERSGGKVEIFLLKRLSDGYSYEVLMKKRSRLRNGDKILLNGGHTYAHILDVDQRIVRFNRKNILPFLKRAGHIPLPPYIKRTDTQQDHEFYQTVYARHAGSVAAPTAGLHFTQELLSRLKNDGHSIFKVLLHINYATFKLVEEEDITRHHMHEEVYSVSARAAQLLIRSKSQGKKIVAVGTTSCRVLEEIVRSRRFKGKTKLFIYPGFDFQMVDVLVTNFHLPFSSLLMLVYAFGSSALMKKAYQEAIERRYRFYSYGDAMLIK